MPGNLLYMNLLEIKEKIEQTIECLEYGKEPKELYDPIRYIMALGGKRMRPLLTVMGYCLFKDDYDRILKAATAVEVFHNFTLVHDDIMDKAPLRRGQSTVHHKWNENIAILSGDVMLVQAYELLLTVEDKYLHSVISKFNRCAAEVCEGQQLDMNFETIHDVSKENYLAMIRLKTAVLLGFALSLGAIVAGADTVIVEELRLFGENIGVGFQLKDDILDVYGDSEKFGKQIGGDIISNKKTYLLIEALAQAKGNTLNELQYWLNQKDFDKEQKVNAVRHIYDELYIRKLAEERMNLFFEEAFRHLESISIDPVRKDFLKNFTTSLIQREN